RECLEQAEHSAQLFVDGSCPIVVEDQLRFAVTKRCLRDRGVCISSKNALIETRYKGGEYFALADRPRRWPAHHLLRENGERVPEEFLAVEERADHTRCMPHHEPDHAQYGFLAKAMTRVNLAQSHASFRALSPASSRWRDAPRAALTTISNI